MLKLKDLALRLDFQMGPLLVSPSRRLVRGPTGELHLEPLIMHVLLLLIDARGSVVTRTELFDQCWGGLMVGDDSLNRAVAKVRRVTSQVAPGLIEIETIPRTGYRLTGAAFEPFESAADDSEVAAAPAHSRRSAIVWGGAVASAAVLGGGLWYALAPRPDPRFEMLMSKADAAIRKMNWSDETLRGLEEAVRLRPDSAKAWGALALTITQTRIESVSPDTSASALESVETAARRALSLDPQDPNALLAMFEVQGSTLNLLQRDRALRRIIEIDPTNILAISELVALLQSSGMNRESWNWNERALAAEPLVPGLLGRKAMKLWIAGRVAEADKIIDQVRGLYPLNSWVWWVRFLILAMTGRAGAAAAMLESGLPESQWFGNADMWRTCLDALQDPSATKLATAREACFEAAKSAGSLAAQTVMIMAALGDVDAAFEIANGFLLWRGPIVRGSGSASSKVAEDAGWRRSIQWLFAPPTAVMRADPRFRALCDGLGLTAYWRARGVKPDYMLQRA